MAKGQTEILGIAIVVVLVIMGLLFLLRFSTPGDSDILKQRLGRAQIANNVISAMLATSDTVCDAVKKPRLQDLLIDCAENQPSGSVVCKQQSTKPTLSCQYVKGVIAEEILAKTVEKWKYGYEFSVKREDKLIIPELKKTSAGQDGKCPAIAELDSQEYPLPTTTDIIKVKLKICN